MRKAIVFTGGIGHLLNLISSTSDEAELDIYVDGFSHLTIDGIHHSLYLLLIIIIIIVLIIIN